MAEQILTTVWQISARSAQFPIHYLYPCLRTDGGKPLADLNLAQPTLFTDGVSMSREIRATGCNHRRASACWFSLCVGKSGKDTCPYLSRCTKSCPYKYQRVARAPDRGCSPLEVTEGHWQSSSLQGEAAASLVCSKPIPAGALLCKDAGWGCVNYWKMKADGGVGLHTVIQEMFQSALPGASSRSVCSGYWPSTLNSQEESWQVPQQSL